MGHRRSPGQGRRGPCPPSSDHSQLHIQPQQLITASEAGSFLQNADCLPARGVESLVRPQSDPRLVRTPARDVAPRSPSSLPELLGGGEGGRCTTAGQHRIRRGDARRLIFPQPQRSSKASRVASDSTQPQPSPTAAASDRRPALSCVHPTCLLHLTTTSIACSTSPPLTAEPLSRCTASVSPPVICPALLHCPNPFLPA